MRLNKWLAEHTKFSRRAADAAIAQGRVSINGSTATVGQLFNRGDNITIDGKPIDATDAKKMIVLLHKPVGYVCSRKGQGAATIYSLLPPHLHALDIAGRLDKDSSGLVLLTNDGTLLHALTHPSNNKIKEYLVTLSSPLTPEDQRAIQNGIDLDDGRSRLALQSLSSKRTDWLIRMSEGRNRQIRRTFSQLGYNVITLHREKIDTYTLGSLRSGSFIVL